MKLFPIDQEILFPHRIPGAGGIQKLAAAGPQGPEDRLVPGFTGARRRVGGADPSHQQLAALGTEVAKIRPMHLAGPEQF